MVSPHTWRIIWLCLYAVVCGGQQQQQQQGGSGVDDGRWLQQLYTATNGDGWSDTDNGSQGSCNGGWNMTTTANPCDGNSSLWRKVICNDDGRVVQVTLWGCNLRGTLPPIIDETMSQLEHFDVSNNALTAGIPSSFGTRLTRLRDLWLSGNQLSGPIPSSLRFLNSLESLLLAGNQFRGTLPKIAVVGSRLRTLQLHVNQLSGTLPSAYSSLSNLHVLYLANNSLTGSLPESYMSLGNVIELSVENNQLTGGLPSSWALAGSLLHLADTALSIKGNCINTTTTSSTNSSSVNWWRAKDFNFAQQRSAGDCPAAPPPSITSPTLSSSRSSSYSFSLDSSITNSAPSSSPSSLDSSSSSSSSGSGGRSASPPSSTSTVTMMVIAQRGQHPSTTTSSSTTVVVVTMPIVALMGGVGGGLLQRSLLQLKFAAGCSVSALGEPLDVASSPTQLTVGSGSNPTRYMAGAVVGNVVLLLAVVGAAYGGSWLAGLDCLSRAPLLVRKPAALLRCIPLPGWAVQPGMLLLQPTVSSAVTCLLQEGDDSNGYAMNTIVGLVGVGLVAIIGCLLMWILLFRFRAEAVKAAPPCRRLNHHHHSDCCSSLIVIMVGLQRGVGRLLQPMHRWRSKATVRDDYGGSSNNNMAARRTATGRTTVVGNSHFVGRFRPLFEGYRGSMHWFLLVEFAASVASGIVSGLLSHRCSADAASSSSSTPVVLVWGITVISIGFLLSIVVLRPYNTQWDFVTSVASNSCSVVWCIVMLIASPSPSPSPAAATWLDVLTALQICCQVVTSAVLPMMVGIAAGITVHCSVFNSDGGMPVGLRVPTPTARRTRRENRRQEQPFAEIDDDEEGVVETPTPSTEAGHHLHPPRHHHYDVRLVELVTLICCTSTTTTSTHFRHL